MRSLKFLALLILLSCLSSCLEERCEDSVTYERLEPVYAIAGEWRESDFKSLEPSDVCRPSGFYVYEELLFIVDLNAGLHILDNSDNDNPQPLSFVDIPGAQGLAVRNKILYINQYTDLLTFDLVDPRNPKFKFRAEDVFNPNTIFADILPGGATVVEWIPTQDTRELTCGETAQEFFIDQRGGWRNRAQFETFDLAVTNSVNSASADVVGRGGSLARFTITNGTLYAVDNQTLRTFDLGEPCEPVFVDDIDLGWGIETIFPRGNELFIGSTTGMHIYDVSQPLAPERLSTFEHVLSCDPVVVQGDLAYVTLWGGRDCGSTGDQLELIDISDLRNPESVQITPMRNSHGLAVTGDKLFLCAADEGLIAFELDGEGYLSRELTRSETINARDVIALPERNELIVLGYDNAGIQQYDYAEEGTLTEQSRIEVCEK